MIIPDVNLLVYAQMTGMPQHAVARRWWETALNGIEPVGLSAVALFGFIRIVANPRVFRPPLPVDQAVARVEAWFERPNVELLLPGPRHLALAFGLLRGLRIAADLTTDVQLAALAIENQAELHSSDTDFARFPGLRWVNPLER